MPTFSFAASVQFNFASNPAPTKDSDNRKEIRGIIVKQNGDVDKEKAGVGIGTESTSETFVVGMPVVGESAWVSCNLSNFVISITLQRRSVFH